VGTGTLGTGISNGQWSEQNSRLFKQFANRWHFLIAEPVREEVAGFALDWAKHLSSKASLIQDSNVPIEARSLASCDDGPGPCATVNVGYPPIYSL